MLACAEGNEHDFHVMFNDVLRCRRDWPQALFPGKGQSFRCGRIGKVPGNVEAERWMMLQSDKNIVGKGVSPDDDGGAEIPSTAVELPFDRSDAGAEEIEERNGNDPNKSKHDPGIGKIPVEERRAHDDQHADRVRLRDVHELVDQDNAASRPVRLPRRVQENPENGHRGRPEHANTRSAKEWREPISLDGGGSHPREPERFEQPAGESEPVGEEEGCFDRHGVADDRQEREEEVPAPRR